LVGAPRAAIGTLMIYADEHDRVGTLRTLTDLVAATLAAPDEGRR
jgi:hypothetical protein